MVGWLGNNRGGKIVASPVGMNDAEIIHSSGMIVRIAVAISNALMMIEAVARFMACNDVAILGTLQAWNLR